MKPPHLNRRGFLAYCTAAGISGTAFPAAILRAAESAVTDQNIITAETVAEAEKLAGLLFTPEQRARIAREISERFLPGYEALRTLPLPNAVLPAFSLDLAHAGAGVPSETGAGLREWRLPDTAPNVGNEEDLAYLPIAGLAALLRNGQVTSSELTELALTRLKRHNPVLEAVVTLTEDRARRQAAQADAELKAGRWRGPLHGIPWGAKDLLAVAGYPTTWGAAPYREQHFDEDAEVVRRLDAAGAVLVAKLSLGALASGDRWFGGRTKCPWNIDEGSSGSSAGSAAAVAAGLLPFSLGSETRGSILSPCRRNGVTGFRPTFGRVSRHGAMVLAWSMDKIGPIARSAQDCALVFAAIHGKDARDPAARDAPFAWPAKTNLRAIRVGFVEDAFEAEYGERETNLRTLETLRALGWQLVPIKYPDIPVRALDTILVAEAASAFDDLTRSGEIEAIIPPDSGYGPSGWPASLRRARFIPAVEYINANRARAQLMRDMETALADVDVVVAPTQSGDMLPITNLTGHPAVAVPDGFTPLIDHPLSPRRTASSITFFGRLYRDDLCLAVAHAFQAATDFHRRRPPIA